MNQVQTFNTGEFSSLMVKFLIKYRLFQVRIAANIGDICLGINMTWSQL